jgi:hypothetical protein|tara:strand:- start:828 stop:1631 length:804 start_codon:yes stop_codon:yes gene_type:complete
MLTRKIFKEQLEKTIDKYHERTKDLVYQAKGLRFNQGLPVCALIDYYDIDLVIESGVCRGMSTEIICSYTKDMGVHVISADIGSYKNNVFESTIDRLTPQYENLKFMKGDSFKIFPKILESNKHLNVAYFIDGPKFGGALKLAKLCTKYDNVKFGAFDDATKETGYHFLDKMDSKFFYTDEKWYYEKYGWLDDVKHESYSKNENDPLWPKKTLEALLEKRRGCKFPQGGGLGITIHEPFEKTNEEYVTGPIPKEDWPVVPEKYKDSE